VPAPPGNPQQQPASIAGAVMTASQHRRRADPRQRPPPVAQQRPVGHAGSKGQSDKNSPEYHHFLTSEQFRASYGPTSADLTAAAASLTALGFTTHLSSQNIIADAPQTVVERGLGVRLTQSLVRGKSVLAADRSAHASRRAREGRRDDLVLAARDARQFAAARSRPRSYRTIAYSPEGRIGSTISSRLTAIPRISDSTARAERSAS